MKHILHIPRIITILLSFFIISYSTQAQLSNFRGELTVTVKNNSGSQMTNCQVPLEINTQLLISLGLMQTNGNDIRFGSDCSGTSLYDYWIQGYMNTDSTVLWVRIPSINPNDSVKVYMFFGNPAASGVSTLSIFNGPWSSTDSVTIPNQNTVSNCQRGFQFTANEKVIVTHFGKKTPNATQRYVTLFDFTSQTIIAQMQVDAGTAGQYNYNSLTNPLLLNSGQTYVLELFNGTGDMYYYGPPTQINPSFTFMLMRYCNSCTQNTFPTSTLTGQHYGIPDFLFYKITSVTPAPTTTFGLPSDTNTPAAPTNLTGQAGNQQAQLKWNKNQEFDMDKYIVFRNTTNNPGTATLIATTNHPDTAYLATGLTNGTTYYFWVKAQDRFCASRVSAFSSVAIVTPVSVAHLDTEIPKIFALHQNYPNPFNPVTKIKYDIPKSSLVKLVVYDITGREVESLINEFMTAGYHEVSFNADNLASGVYFYKIEAGTFTDKKKMIILK